MIRLLLFFLLFIGLYRLLTRFIFPILRITSSVRRQMNTMAGSGSTPKAEAPAASRPARKGDYIDFEEVR